MLELNTPSVPVRLAGTFGTIVLVILANLVWKYLSLQQKFKKMVDLPVLNLKDDEYKQAEQSYITDMAGYLEMGRKKFREKGFQLWGPEGYLVVLPEVFVDELKSLDPSVIDNDSFFRSVIGDYPWVQIFHPIVGRAIVYQLNPKLGKLMPDINDEMVHALNAEIPLCQDWTPVKINAKLLRLVSIVSARIFVGSPLCHDEEWIQASINFTLDIFQAGSKIRELSDISKYFAIKFGTIPEVSQINVWQKLARDRIVPILEERTIAQAARPDDEKPQDMIQWIMNDSSAQSPPIPFNKQAEIQLMVGIASIHATASAVTNTFYDLVSRPEYLQAIREEIDQVWDEADGELEKKSMSQMVKLDSFMKESQRLAPSQHITFDREVHSKKGVTLSNGMHMPRGTHFAMASSQISLDPNCWDNPEEFHGFRFAALRGQSKADANKFQFVTTHSGHSMSFGHGKHACPGRFFSSNIIKTIVAHVVHGYDLKAAPETPGRPESLIFGSSLTPNPEINIMMKKRGDGY